ncbi:MAG: NADH:ubiquinone reductase (Na(+)-transporting) subunit B [Prevotellaceae bacterium]|jgi:Na+-transporting NADH:ubiquinone oxidoreductase subunit B|nr:NADH:ubiquinone reductase (Na(+)-transporting) subunit B [Prevotellaceae bacterium]
MKPLRKLLDKMKPTFSKGGKLGAFHSTFDAFETFLFVPKTTTKVGSHIRDSIDLKRTMSVVILALVPALLFGMWNTGYQHFLSMGQEVTFWQNVWFGFLKMLPLIVVSYVVGLGIEFAFAQKRGHEVNEGFLVSGMLIPLIMPIDVPLWMVAIATAFAVIIGKEVFGGTGMNIFNPALLARAFVFFAYPSRISGDKVWIEGLSKGEGIIDGFSGATPLAIAGSGVGESAKSMGFDQFMDQLPSVQDLFMGFIPGSIGEVSKVAILLGAVILILTGIASWKIMVSGVVGVLATGLLLNWLAPDAAGESPNYYMMMPAYYHLLMGGFAFGIVFMATDPVSAAQTERGKWIYGLLIGVMVVIIRVFNPAYPEGTMLVILFANLMAPLIDYYVVEGNIKRRLKRVKKAVAKS